MHFVELLLRDPKRGSRKVAPDPEVLLKRRWLSVTRFNGQEAPPVKVEHHHHHAGSPPRC